MSSGILGELYQNQHQTVYIRQSSIEVWVDLFQYAKNLNGNWLVSQEIFNKCLFPTAYENPEYFAVCVEDMVLQSGFGIKKKSSYIKALKNLKNLRKKTLDNTKITKALIDILNSGLVEPLYAQKALLKSGYALL